MLRRSSRVRRTLPRLLIGVVVSACAPSGSPGSAERERVEQLELQLGTLRAEVDHLRGEVEALRPLAEQARASEERRHEREARREELRARRKTRIDAGDETPEKLAAIHEIPEGAITCRDDVTCTVQRDYLDRLLSEPALLARQARLVPSVRDGETAGFRFYGIRPHSVPKALRIKNGDMLVSLNGDALDSLDKAMAAYATVSRANELVLGFERKGLPRELTVTIAD